MIERKFVAQNIKEFEIKKYLFNELSRVGLSDVKLQRTPLGEKILVSASRPGLVVGKGGSNITRLTKELKEKFKLENPQIEIEEVLDARGDASITAEMIANFLERYGPQRFKGVGHKAMSTVMSSGALGVEILISGKIPSSRAKTWRFYMGYLKKCGDISVSGVYKSQQIARLKSGVIGIQVTIMPGTTVLPDKIEVLTEPIQIVEEVETETKSEKEDKPKKKVKKKTPKKKTAKKEETKEDSVKEDVKEETEESLEPAKEESKDSESEKPEVEK
ncbi:30S ribosomal protein S3 [Candidatus Woesearchaeota archaeon]|nr:30S ribosomal protein S3 [Candidatus Woesearchaeota archaeon]MCF7901668.1 30S ribosomal protein S3 [Candidatus Woesearchaeota archaeon]MCF8013342.1 30S ribosomal protein S3 [Candidatus Woesearchaeota archaeon]